MLYELLILILLSIISHCKKMLYFNHSTVIGWSSCSQFWATTHSTAMNMLVRVSGCTCACFLGEGLNTCESNGWTARGWHLLTHCQLFNVAALIYTLGTTNNKFLFLHMLPNTCYFQSFKLFIKL